MGTKKSQDRVTIPFETLRSLMPKTLDTLPNPIEFQSVVGGKIVSVRKRWGGIGFSGNRPADGTEPILVIDEEVVHAEIRKAKTKARPIPAGNYDRVWCRCPRCGFYQYRDYVPYSMSNPIVVTACGHGRYEDLHHVVTFHQKVGGKRVATEWHDLMDMLDADARAYIDGLKSKRAGGG